MESKKIIVLIVIILIVVLLILFIYKVNQRNEKGLKQREKLKLKNDHKREKLKEENPKKYDEIKIKEEIEENLKAKKNMLWKQSRVGLFIFMMPHLFFEILFSENSLSTGQPNFSLPIVINFMISRYFIKRNIFKRNKIIDNPIMYGIGISLIVFCVRIFLGFISFLLIN